jgi:integrase/recombinase XerD
LVDLLRDWYRIARPTVWLFPGRDPMLPMTPRRFIAPFTPPPAWRDQEARDTAHAAHSFATTCSSRISMFA